VIEKKIVSLSNPKSSAAEAYRMIRTNLEYTDIDKKNKVIAITSALPSEGKTTTLANIAVNLANVGEKVLIIDCDLRKPKMHSMFQLSNEVGVTNLLMKNKIQADVIQTVGEVIGLDIITSGHTPAMPAELLGSYSMKMLVEDLKHKYDRILIDTPPVLQVADAGIVARYADGIVLVAAIAECGIEDIKTAKKSLEKVGANILGCVLSKAEMGKKGYYYYRYGYYYGDDHKKTGKRGRSKSSKKTLEQ